MFNKKYLLIILLLIISISTISAVSATDNVTDTVSIDDANTEDIVSNIDEEQYATLQDASDDNELASNDDSQLAVDESSDELSYYFVESDDYSVDFGDDAQTISSANGGKIQFYVNPCTDTNYYAYDFNLIVSKTLDIKDKIFELRCYDGASSARTAQYYTYTFSQKFTPGTYFLIAANYKDDTLMALGVLGVSGNAVIKSSNYEAYYNSGNEMTVSAADSSGSPINMMQIKCTFTKGTKTVTETYITDSSGKVTFVPPVGPGTWDVIISSGYKHISASSIKQKVTVKQSQVDLKAYKNTVYKGDKITLKATVKSQGKNVNEGTVTFKINGKTYKVNVKNGVATKKIKLGKVKTYKYTASFKSDNFATKTASSSAVVKNKIATKIVFNDQVAYTASFKTVYIKVLTKDGKKVNGGKIVGNGESYDVINGQVKLTKYGLPNNYFYKSGSNTVKYFKSTIVKKATIKYVPDSNKYKSCTKTIKMTFKFSCAVDRYTGTHYHYSNGYRVHVIVS